MGNVKSRDSKSSIRQALHEVWIPDSERDGCFHCRAPFTVRLRRHHCRSCGELFCKECWCKKADLPPSLFPGVQDGARKSQPVCEACCAILSLPQGVGQRLWNSGIEVRVVSAELKTRSGGGLKGSASASTAVKQDVDDVAYTLRLERWRPFNRLTCIAVQRSAAQQDRRARSATLPPVVSPRVTAEPHHHATIKSATLDVAAEHHRPSSMPESLSRLGGTGRARSFARAVSNSDVGPHHHPATSPPRSAGAGPPSMAQSPDAGPAPVPVEEGASSVSFAQASTPTGTAISVGGYLAAPGSHASPDGGAAHPTAAGGPAPPPAAAAPRLPESWESPLGDLVSISLEQGRGGVASVRCETKKDVVCYAPVSGGATDAVELENVLTMIVRVARQRSVVRVSENSSRALSSGGGRGATGGGSGGSGGR